METRAKMWWIKHRVLHPGLDASRRRVRIAAVAQKIDLAAWGVRQFGLVRWVRQQRMIERLAREYEIRRAEEARWNNWD